MLRLIALASATLAAPVMAQPAVPSLAPLPEFHIRPAHPVSDHPAPRSPAPVVLYPVASAGPGVETAVWTGVLIGATVVAASGWYAVGAGSRADADTDAARAARTVTLGLGLSLAVPSTAGVGYAGYRVVRSLR